MTGFRFTLYVAGAGARSAIAERAFRDLCAERLPADGYEITVIDVLEAIEEADAARTLVTPTVVRTDPPPAVRVMGDLSASDELADAVGLPRTHGRGAP